MRTRDIYTGLGLLVVFLLQTSPVLAGNVLSSSSITIPPVDPTLLPRALSQTVSLVFGLALVATLANVLCRRVALVNARTEGRPTALSSLRWALALLLGTAVSWSALATLVANIKVVV